MTKNPLINALVAALYITIVASLMFYGSDALPTEDRLIMPIAMISLFTLSAAVMGHCFLYQPLQMYFDGEKKSAAKLFVQTIGAFAVITALIFLAMLYGNI